MKTISQMLPHDSDIFLKKKHWGWFIIFTGLIVALEIFLAKSIVAKPGVFFKRTEIVLLFYLFLTAHCFIKIENIYEWVYRYRIILCLALFLFCVANCFTFSSVTLWDAYIQPGEGSEYIQPLLGKARDIRSDEWLVTVPRTISGDLTNYGPVNHIVRATSVSNLSASGLQWDYSMLRAPGYWGYYFLGAEYGSSFDWCYHLIFGFLFMFELCMIITKEDKLVSFFGAGLIWLSMFNMWWSLVPTLFGFAAVIVLFYHFVRTDSSLKRLMFGTMLAFAGSHFFTYLYPAWMIPAGWIIVSILVWILIENQPWKTFKVKDWLIFAVDVLFMATIILSYVHLNSEYMNAITATVYPGRREVFGGFSLNKLAGYLSSSLTPFLGYANPSEKGVVFGVFPLGYMLLIYVQIKQKWKNKLLWALTPVLILLTCYCSFSLPKLAVKILFFSYSTQFRAVDFLGVLLAIVTIACLAEIRKAEGMNRWVALGISIISIIPAVKWDIVQGDGYYTGLLWAMAVAVVVFLFFSLTKTKLQALAYIVEVIFVMGCGLFVNPLTVGLDALTSKPAYQAVADIVETDQYARWIGVDSFVTPQFLISAGAPTINSVNYIPNVDMWKQLDPDKKYEEVWNRYAHMEINLTSAEESSYEIVQDDLIRLTLCREDLKKLDVKYIAISGEISEELQGNLEELYSEHGFSIYRVVQ